MKKATYILSALLLTTIFATNAVAQVTHLRTFELKPFNEIVFDSETEIIIIKSTRNQLSISGDSTFIAEFEVENSENKLSFELDKDQSEKVVRVIVEYTTLDRAVTSGSGQYYFVKLDEENLKIYNEDGKISLRGRTDSIKIYSEKGENDFSNLTVKNMLAYLGEAATILEPKNQ
ncbi:MAG: hypothetical protein CL670_13455 [Balneola sp.]|jgi:hypothetical protein|nr:hypothetical protein [Balneola sp.]MBE80157.1 hypothetical protein [Balneola sp.]HBX65233.1 hypothetical protein [Balneolaceae bacterium]|tara:strand:+ start:318 stop:842 length:525 start_codon:yes stop_codon:yes gene_type:complete